MTYITGGRFNNNPFLMIDSYCEDQNGNGIYSDKVEKITSSKEDLYFCQMGFTGVKWLVLIYNLILEFEQREINFFDKDEFISMMDDISKIVQETGHDTTNFDENVFFFISRNNIVKYELYFDSQNKKFHRISLTNVENNQCVTSNSCLVNNVDNSDLETYCKSVIKQEMHCNDDLIRYSFLISDGEKLTYQPSHKSRKDMINMFFNLGFDKLNKY